MLSAPATVPAPPAPAAAAAPAAAVYHLRCERFGRERDRYTAEWNRIANFRLLAFVAAVIAISIGLWQGLPWLTGAGALLLVAFVALVYYHNQLAWLRRRYTELWQINDEAAKRLARDWAALPQRHSRSAEPAHPYAADLDLFGHASLFQLLETMGTHMGEETLQRWLVAPAPLETVRLRQPAVAELAPLIDLRDELTVRGRLLGEPKPDPAPFLAWAEAAPWLLARRGLLWVGRASVVLLWVLLLAQLAGWLADPFWTILVIVNLGIRALLGRRVRATLQQATANERAFHQYAEALHLLAAAPFTAPLLQRLQADLTVDGKAAHLYMARVHALGGWMMPEDSLLNIPLQLLTLWDVQLLAALEGWQAVAGGRARAWLAVLGEAEALAALAVLAHDNPSWAFPDLDAGAPALDARDLGHPLLAASVRVTNDVRVGPPGTFLLVTGSNMSGKSTLLRAIGLNLVLAQAGGPVCASTFRAPPVTLWTSMRIQDSLEQGVSYFMAELQRLKAIVDAAGQAPAAARPVCYLLDEILQGTNTAERQIAARRIILYLVAQGALGAVSTHDLTLAAAPEVAAAAQAIHFTETFTTGPTGPAMQFDYKIRPGIATSTNALRLMELIGLHLADDAGLTG
ncbi:MAG TPA: DNA mismatch repair protein MutS [Chloroflexia bacterium]|nr:DNA mismatch repair protein MutS [Chloroflexia bacterium]